MYQQLVCCLKWRLVRQKAGQYFTSLWTTSFWPIRWQNRLCFVGNAHMQCWTQRAFPHLSNVRRHFKRSCRYLPGYANSDHLCVSRHCVTQRKTASKSSLGPDEHHYATQCLTYYVTIFTNTHKSTRLIGVYLWALVEIGYKDTTSVHKFLAKRKRGYVHKNTRSTGFTFGSEVNIGHKEDTTSVHNFLANDAKTVYICFLRSIRRTIVHSQ